MLETYMTYDVTYPVGCRHPLPGNVKPGRTQLHEEQQMGLLIGEHIGCWRYFTVFVFFRPGTNVTNEQG